MGIGSSFAPRSDQIFTIRYVLFYACGFVIGVSESVNVSVPESRPYQKSTLFQVRNSAYLLTACERNTRE